MPHELELFSALIFSLALSRVAGVRIGGGAFGVRSGGCALGAGGFGFARQGGIVASAFGGVVASVFFLVFLGGGDVGSAVGSVGIGDVVARLPFPSNNGGSRVCWTWL